MSALARMALWVAIGALASIGGLANAQQRPGGNGPLPGDPGYGARDVPPPPPFSSGYTPPAPSTSYAAVAFGKKAGVSGYFFWFEGDYARSDVAGPEAVRACQKAGGLECKVALVFGGGTVGIAASDDGLLFAVSDANFYKAMDEPVRYCLANGKSGCRRVGLFNSWNASGSGGASPD